MNRCQEVMAERIIAIAKKEMKAAMEMEIKVTLVTLKDEEYHNGWLKKDKLQTRRFHSPSHTTWVGTREAQGINTTLYQITPSLSVGTLDALLTVLCSVKNVTSVHCD